MVVYVSGFQVARYDPAAFIYGRNNVCLSIFPIEHLHIRRLNIANSKANECEFVDDVVPCIYLLFGLQMCVLFDSVLSRWTPRYTIVIVLTSMVPFKVTFRSRLASLFLRWKAHTWVLDALARSWFNLSSWLPALM